MIVLFFITYRMDALLKPLRRYTIIITHEMKTYQIINVCERLLDELVKELLDEHYTVVSASYRQVDGRKVRVRKGHLRRKRRK